MSENSKTVYFGTGHRKEAVARVRIVPGSGQSWINGTPGEAYLQFSPTYIRIYKSPLSTLGLDNKYDIYQCCSVIEDAFDTNSLIIQNIVNYYNLLLSKK